MGDWFDRLQVDLVRLHQLLAVAGGALALWTFYMNLRENWRRGRQLQRDRVVAWDRWDRPRLEEDRKALSTAFEAHIDKAEKTGEPALTNQIDKVLESGGIAATTPIDQEAESDNGGHLEASQGRDASHDGTETQPHPRPLKTALDNVLDYREHLALLVLSGSADEELGFEIVGKNQLTFVLCFWTYIYRRRHGNEWGAPAAATDKPGGPRQWEYLVRLTPRWHSKLLALCNQRLKQKAAHPAWANTREWLSTSSWADILKYCRDQPLKCAPEVRPRG